MNKWKFQIWISLWIDFSDFHDLKTFTVWIFRAFTTAVTWLKPRIFLKFWKTNASTRWVIPFNHFMISSSFAMSVLAVSQFQYETSLCFLVRNGVLEREEKHLETLRSWPWRNNHPYNPYILRNSLHDSNVPLCCYRFSEQQHLKLLSHTRPLHH